MGEFGIKGPPAVLSQEAVEEKVILKVVVVSDVVDEAAPYQLTTGLHRLLSTYGHRQTGNLNTGPRSLLSHHSQPLHNLALN